MRTLKQLLSDRKLFKQFTLFFDIETFLYNEKEGRKKPSKYKNMTFSVAISWIENGIVEEQVFSSFKEPFEIIIAEYSKQKKKPRITLNAHNTNKYDNHFLRKDLLYYFPEMEIKNYWLNTPTTEKSNKDSFKIKELTKKEKQATILEKRIKSSINLEMIFYLKGIQFTTEDNWVKSNASLKMLGEKLYRLDRVTKEELKTDFDYNKYNVEKDLTEEEARNYALEIYQQLSQDELTYIKNDVIILAKAVYYYSDLFKGFDYSKKTFTSNILESYNTNDLTSFQLLNRIGEGKEKREVRYTDYQFSNKNFYDYLKPFYRGGLNFYNHRYIGKIIKGGVFGMDINSSYPYAMHNFKIPTYIKSHESFDTPEIVPINYSEDEYTLFQLSKEHFDLLILDKIDSVILKQMFVKYYSTDEFINLNTYTFKMINKIVNIKITEIPVYSRITFETEYFGSRNQIADFYKTKTQGKNEKKIDFKSPYDIQVTEQENDEQLSPEEVDNSKVNLNGLYGIPALRPYFNLFRRDEAGNYYNIENGHQNAERNIVFSIFVTSVSLWNLLSPFQFLSQEEIDENFLYSDTDSLYFKEKVKNKIPDSIYSDFSLGDWDLEHEHLENFYVLNHKKYAYTDEEGEIQVRSGGIPHKSFDREMSFEQFIDTQFSHGVEIQTLKSIYNEEETISIYNSKTKLEIGKNYRMQANSEFYDQMKKKIFKEVKEEKEDNLESKALYIESIIGTFSMAEIYPFTHEVKKKKPLVYLEIEQDLIKNRIKDSKEG